MPSFCLHRGTYNLHVLDRLDESILIEWLFAIFMYPYLMLSCPLLSNAIQLSHFFRLSSGMCEEAFYSLYAAVVFLYATGHFFRYMQRSFFSLYAAVVFFVICSGHFFICNGHFFRYMQRSFFSLYAAVIFSLHASVIFFVISLSLFSLYAAVECVLKKVYVQHMLTKNIEHFP